MGSSYTTGVGFKRRNVVGCFGSKVPNASSKHGLHLTKLPDIWQVCDLCRSHGSAVWVDPYPGCCAMCAAATKDADNVTTICAGLMPPEAILGV